MIARRISVGGTGRKYMPYSEVNMHMEVAGKPLYFKLVDSWSVQLYRDSDFTELFSFPITTGEAGILVDADGGMYYYPDDSMSAYPPSVNDDMANVNNPLFE